MADIMPSGYQEWLKNQDKMKEAVETARAFAKAFGKADDEISKINEKIKILRQYTKAGVEERRKENEQIKKRKKVLDDIAKKHREIFSQRVKVARADRGSEKRELDHLKKLIKQRENLHKKDIRRAKAEAAAWKSHKESGAWTAGKVKGAAGVVGRKAMDIPKVGDLLKGIGFIVKELGSVAKLLVKNPLIKFFAKLLDFDELTRFHRELNEAIGGIDMFGTSLEGIKTTGLRDRLEGVAGGLENIADNMTYMTTSASRKEVLAAFEVAGIKSAEYLENLGEGMEDVTLAATVMGRVVGRSAAEIANRMGEVVFQTGIAEEEITGVFANMIDQASRAGINQRRFMDAMVSASQSIGIYKDQLGGASALLSEMTEQAIAPASVTLQDFSNTIQAMRGMSMESIVATFNMVADTEPMKDALQALKDDLGGEFGALASNMQGILGGNFEEVLALDRNEIERRISEAEAAGKINQEQVNQLREIGVKIAELSPLLEGGRESTLGLIDAVQRGALDSRVFQVMINELAKNAGASEGLRGANRKQLMELEAITGVSLQTLQTMQRTSLSSEQLVKLLQEDSKRTDEEQRQLDDLRAASRNIVRTLVDPAALTFEVTMTRFVRSIQRMLLEFVNKLFPYAMDIFSEILKGIGNMTKGIGQLIGSETIFNAGDAILTMGGEIQKALKEGNKATADSIKSTLEEREARRAEQLSTLRKGGLEEEEEQAARLLERQRFALENFKEEIEKIQEMADNGAISIGDAANRMGELQERMDELNQVQDPDLIQEMTDASWDRIRAMENEQELERQGQQMGAMGRIARGVITGETPSANLAERGAATVIRNSPLGLASRAVSGLVSQITGRRAEGGIDFTPRTVRFAETGPEAAIPLRDVPEVFAKTIAAAGGAGAGGPTVTVGSMSFVLPESASGNPQAYANEIRRVIAQEFKGMLRSQRPT